MINLQNQRLKEEQLLHIKTLLKQVKDKDKEVEKAVEVGHEQVEAALLEKFDAMKAEEADVQGACTIILSSLNGHFFCQYYYRHIFLHNELP